MIEWVFFVTILTTDVVPETGWQKLEVLEFTLPTRDDCREARERAVRALVPDVSGEGVVVSGCRQKR